MLAVGDVSMYVTASSLAEIVEVANTKISNQNDADKDMIAGRTGRQNSTPKLNLIGCYFVSLW